MKRFVYRLLSAVIALLPISSSSHAMDLPKPELSLEEQAMEQVTELLCCLDLNDVPTDIDPIIVKPLTLINYVLLSFEQSIDSKDPIHIRSSLIIFCEKLAKVTHWIDTNELGKQLATFCTKRGISLLDTPDGTKFTILHHFAEAYSFRSDITDNNLKALKIVLAAVGKNAQELAMVRDMHDSTALARAAAYGSDEMIITILTTPTIDAQKLVLMKDPKGKTVLHIAAQWCRYPLVKSLLNLPGIDTYELTIAQDNDGKTALEVAHEKGYSYIVELIKPHMHKKN